MQRFIAREDISMENIAILSKKIINLCRIPAQINSQIFDAKHSEFYQLFVHSFILSQPFPSLLALSSSGINGYLWMS